MFNGSSNSIQGNGYFSDIIPKFTLIEALKIKNLGTQHLYVFWSILQLEHIAGSFINISSRYRIDCKFPNKSLHSHERLLNNPKLAGILQVQHFLCKISLHSLHNISKKQESSKDKEIQQEIVL